jgi:LPXTG-motif cell wall-anchored protein
MTHMRTLTAILASAGVVLLPASALAADPAAPSPPAATPAQDDVSGGNEYSEQAPPTPTDEPEPPTAPAQADSVDDDAPAATAPSSTTAQPSASTEATTAADTLPRTGAEALVVALIGILLIGCGLMVRRFAAPPRLR